MANLALVIAFSEANTPRVIKALCARAGLPESEANAKVALKQLAVEAVRQQEVAAAREEAEKTPAPS